MPLMMQVRRKDLPIPGVQHQGKGGLVSPASGSLARRPMPGESSMRPSPQSRWRTENFGHETPDIVEKGMDRGIDRLGFEDRGPQNAEIAPLRP